MEYASQGYTTKGQQAALNCATTSSPPPTLTRAISESEALNKRLSELGGRIAHIAQSIGGPFPVSDDKCADPTPSSAVYRLNYSIDSAHRQITEIENSLSALQRTLGE